MAAMVRTASDFDRFRSFAERYVIARAPEFEKETEQLDAWEALLNARTIYEQIGTMSKHVDKPDTQMAAGQSSGQFPGATGTGNIALAPRASPQVPTQQTINQTISAPVPAPSLKTIVRGMVNRLFPY